MGCVDTKDKLYKTGEDLTDDYISVYEMRKVMLQLIFNAKEKRLLKEMNVAKKKIDKIRETMDALVKSYNLFAEANDVQTQMISEAKIKHRENIKFLSENKAFMNIPELFNRAYDLKVAESKFKDKHMGDQELLTSLSWPELMQEPVEKKAE